MNDNTVTNGDVVTFTMQVRNTGNGPARNTVVADSLPAGTEFVSCTNGCSPSTPGTTQTEWNLGTVNPGATPTVTLTVKVLRTDICDICNSATVRTPDQHDNSPISSNQVCLNNTPGAHPEGAHANGSAYAALANAPLLGINNLRFPSRTIDSSQSGVGADSDADSVAIVAVPPPGGAILRANLLSAQSDSEVTAQPAQSVQRSTSEVLGVNLVNGLVRAEVVRANATTVATGSSSSYSATGSTFTNLVVNGIARANVAPNTPIKLPAALFGPGSYVALFEQTGTATRPGAFETSGGTYAADLTVNMIRVHITRLAPLNTPVDITVANAVAHSDFPQTVLCDLTPPFQSVSGHAFIASVDTTPSVIPTLLGYSDIPASGGHGHQEVASVNTSQPAERDPADDGGGVE